MNTQQAGSVYSPPEELIYFIRERTQILIKKEAGLPKPWSDDPVFQTTYFCNVKREDDKVTKWIRNFYSPYASHEMFEFNILLSRFLNRTSTLEKLGFIDRVEWEEGKIEGVLSALQANGEKIWGGAYIITTHGIPMGKVDYLCNNVLESAYKHIEHVKEATLCHSAWVVLQAIEGVGSFLAAQIVADLKNTVGHQLTQADDWWTFVAPGPGSLRGASWFHYGKPEGVTVSNFHRHFEEIAIYVDRHLHDIVLCNQDLQNCLCEFDKYMRVKNGTGRSKRGYKGI